MKLSHIRLLSSVLLAPLPVQAWFPVPPRPLAERVRMSTHVLVGEIERVYLVSEAVRVIPPSEAARQTERLLIDPLVETKIRVKGTLLWSKEHPKAVVYLRYRLPGAGYF